MPDTHAANQRPQIKAREGSSHLRRKRLLTVLVILVATTYTVPEGMKQVVVMRFSRVWTERCVWIGRNGHRLKHWGGLLIRHRRGRRASMLLDRDCRLLRRGDRACLARRQRQYCSQHNQS